MTMVYQWKSGASIKLDPEVAGAVLERLRTTHNGRLTAEAVVTEAQPRTSPLHDAFEWDDRKAGRKWRLEQASHMIRSIEVIRLTPEQSKPIRAFVSVLRDEDRSYTSTAHALSDPELRAQVVSQAWRDLEAWRQRHAELIEFAAVFTAMDQARGA
ncbi:hypothetical protein [Sphingopyxis macrogoltabida]|nr:hypothetical protein [Sphingopyxis macrogoltabida]